MKKLFLLSVAMLLCSSMFAETETDKLIGTQSGFLYQGDTGKDPGIYIKSKKGSVKMLLKNQSGWSRYGYCEFPIDELADNASKVSLVTYLVGPELAQGTEYCSEDFTGKGVEMCLFGGDYDYDENWTWDTQPIIANPTDPGETLLVTKPLINDDKDTYLSFDVTEFVKAKKTAGKTHVCFRFTAGTTPKEVQLVTRQLYVKDGEVATSAYNPYLEVEKTATVGLGTVTSESALTVFPTVTDGLLNIASEASTVEIFNLTGNLVSKQAVVNNTIDVSGLSNGLYLIKAGNETAKFMKK